MSPANSPQLISPTDRTAIFFRPCLPLRFLCAFAPLRLGSIRIKVCGHGRHSPDSPAVRAGTPTTSAATKSRNRRWLSWQALCREIRTQYQVPDVSKRIASRTRHKPAAVSPSRAARTCRLPVIITASRRFPVFRQMPREDGGADVLLRMDATASANVAPAGRQRELPEANDFVPACTFLIRQANPASLPAAHPRSSL
jgi:hypothetical protein